MQSQWEQPLSLPWGVEVGCLYEEGWLGSVRLLSFFLPPTIPYESQGGASSVCWTIIPGGGEFSVQGMGSEFGATWSDVLGYFAARGYGDGMGPGQLWLQILHFLCNKVRWI